MEKPAGLSLDVESSPEACVEINLRRPLIRAKCDSPTPVVIPLLFFLSYFFLLTFFFVELFSHHSDKTNIASSSNKSSSDFFLGGGGFKRTPVKTSSTHLF